MAFMLFGLLPTIFATFLTAPAAKLAFTCVLLLAPPNQVRARVGVMVRVTVGLGLGLA